MEQALCDLDVEGVFSRGATRGDVLLLCGTLPPDAGDTGAARRLNPAGPLLDEWLADASEAPQLLPGPHVVVEERGPATPACPPARAIAELWRTFPGLQLSDGTTVYGPSTIAERTSTFEVQRYAPGWALVGDDSGGTGYLMRALGDAFDPATARRGAEVYALGLGALSPDVEEAGEYVTDDLLTWLAERADRLGG